MPLPEGFLPRKGDELLIRAKVSFDVEPDDEDVHLEPIGAEWKKIMIPLANVHELHQRSWKKGEKVRSREFDGIGLIMAIDGCWIWIKEISGENEGSMWTLEANELEPYVEPEELAVERMTEAELLAGLEHLVPAPAPGSQSIVGDDEAIEG
jgi:hypothetical protein